MENFGGASVSSNPLPGPSSYGTVKMQCHSSQDSPNYWSLDTAWIDVIAQVGGRVFAGTIESGVSTSREVRND